MVKCSETEYSTCKIRIRRGRALRGVGSAIRRGRGILRQARLVEKCALDEGGSSGDGKDKGGYY